MLNIMPLEIVFRQISPWSCGGYGQCVILETMPNVSGSVDYILFESIFDEKYNTTSDKADWNCNIPSNRSYKDLYGWLQTGRLFAL